MRALLFGAMACCAVLVLAATRRPRGHRQIGTSSEALRSDPVGRVGAAVRARCRLQASPLGDTTLGWLSPSLLVLALLAPIVAVLVALAICLQAQLGLHRSRLASERDVLRALPDTVDLLLLCAGAGLALPLAHPLVAARVPAPIGPALLAADAAAASGGPRADALLDALSPLGEQSASLAHVLADHLRYGVPLRPGLERIGLELRLDRRRRAEEDARKVPVRLLAPLVTCILPAFGLLTIVPLLAASLRALPR